MTVSVIVATFNRARMLDDCIASLLRQTWEPGDQLIVVDNGSTDDTAAVVSRAHRAAPHLVRYLRETVPGKSAALHTALAAAAGDVIAFTDDDVRVDADWLSAIRTAMADPGVALVGGPVRPRWETAAPRWLRPGAGPYNRLAAPIALLDYGDAAVDLGPRTLLGANMAIRRAALMALGGFATHLGKLRDTLLSGEDADLCARVQARGWRGVYTPTATVRHWVPASRMRLGYYLAWFYWSGITHAALDADAGRAGRAPAGIPLWVARRLAGSIGRTAVAALRRRPALVVEHAIEIAFVGGYLVRRWRLTSVATRVHRSPRSRAA